MYWYEEELVAEYEQQVSKRRKEESSFETEALDGEHLARAAAPLEMTVQEIQAMKMGEGGMAMNSN